MQGFFVCFVYIFIFCVVIMANTISWQVMTQCKRCFEKAFLWRSWSWCIDFLFLFWQMLYHPSTGQCLISKYENHVIYAALHICNDAEDQKWILQTWQSCLWINQNSIYALITLEEHNVPDYITLFIWLLVCFYAIILDTTWYKHQLDGSHCNK